MVNQNCKRQLRFDVHDSAPEVWVLLEENIGTCEEIEFVSLKIRF